MPLDFNTALKKPGNIVYDGSILKQTMVYGGKTLCLIDFPIQNLTGRIGFKMVQLKKGATIIINVLPKKVYEAMNELWVVNKMEAGCYAIGNENYNYGWEKC